MNINIQSFPDDFPDQSILLDNKKSNLNFLATQNGATMGFCSIWHHNTPNYQNYTVGLVGHFNAASIEVGKLLIQASCKTLKSLGVNYVIGPMNGSSWYHYRLMTYRDPNFPLFFLEKETDPSEITCFLKAGFNIIAKYYSACAEVLDYSDPIAQNWDLKIKEDQLQSITIECFDKKNSEKILSEIFDISIIGFSKNFLYSPIDRDSFLELYRKIVPMVDPDYFLLVRDRGNLIAFIFAIPDFEQKQRGMDIDCLVIKTLVKVPDKQYSGIGSYLTWLIQHKAKDAGFKKAIHAYMYCENHSTRISQKSAKIIREYALYGKQL
jgi:hypothetical protein